MSFPAYKTFPLYLSFLYSPRCRNSRSGSRILVVALGDLNQGMAIDYVSGMLPGALMAGGCSPFMAGK